jgi:OHCU decarboxylase
MMTTTIEHVNQCTHHEFVAMVGPVFEWSPWIAAAAAERRPFFSRAALHEALCAIVRDAPVEQQIALIRAHPDLVERTVRANTASPFNPQITVESQREQAAAGLTRLTPDEIASFARYNTAYHARFGFPFVICARKNKKEAILEAFPVRMAHERDEEIAIALDQIFQIAALRLADLVPGARG